MEVSRTFLCVRRDDPAFEVLRSVDASIEGVKATP